MGYAPQASAETCAMTSIVVLGVSTPSAGSSGAGTNSLACGVNNSTTGNTTVAVGTNNVASGGTAAYESSVAMGAFNAANGLSSVAVGGLRSEEHTSELQSLMRTSYAVFCLKKKKT